MAQPETKSLLSCFCGSSSGPTMSARVFVTRRVQKEALDILREKCSVDVWDSDEPCPRDTLMSKVKDVNGIFCTISDNINADVLNAAGSALQIVATMSAASHHIDTEECKRRNVYVTTVPVFTADSTAELTCTLLLVIARRCVEGHAAVRNNEWGLWKPMWLCGTEFHGRTLGVLGFGRVGYGVARRMIPFDIKRVIYSDIRHQPEAAMVSAELVNMDTLFRESDFLVITVELSESTKKIVNRENLAKMKPSAILVNTSRGAVVDTDALAEALRTDKLTGAALDVTDPEPLPASHPLVSLPNCIITPHMGTATQKTRVGMAVHTAKDIVALLVNKSFVTVTSKHQ